MNDFTLFHRLKNLVRLGSFCNLFLHKSAPHPTLGALMDKHGGASSGFDYMRLILALGVLFYHSFGVTVGTDFVAAIWSGPYRGVVGIILPIFFALSGFLVTASLLRARSLPHFILYRVLRIIPALCVEVTLCALVLGPLLTTKPLGDYFSDPLFASYFLNIIGDIHYNLPGVFANNPRPDIVNISLWTIPYELESYLALIAIAIFGLIRRRLVLLLLFLCGLVVATIYITIWGIALMHVRPVGTALVAAFLAGCLMYLYREKIPHDPFLAFLSIVCMPLTLFLPQTSFLTAIPAAYLTVFLGSLNPRKDNFFMRGDYSYGIYLFAFPMQQTVYFLWPQYNHWWFNVTMATLFAFTWAFLSWHLIENPILKRKKFISEKLLPYKHPGKR